jgi:hypothetical protein
MPNKKKTPNESQGIIHMKKTRIATMGRLANVVTATISPVCSIVASLAGNIF